MDKKTDFDIQGAGTLRISNEAGWKCGTATGFHIGVSWSAMPFCGGVIDAAEAKELATHILAVLGETAND